MHISSLSLALVGLFPCILYAASPKVINRAIAGQGWSLQSDNCPANTKLCGTPACCPANSYCQATGNGEVLACCPNSSNCRGSVEGSPSCADAAWSLWKGQYGNGFCCEVGLTGVFRYGDPTAGKCGSSVPAGYSTAQLITSGTGNSGGNPSTTTIKPSATTITTSTTSKKTTTSSATSISSINSVPSSIPNGKKVFAHYMIGSTTQAETLQDVQDAKKAGFDGFALNTNTITAQFATDAIEWLFQAADNNDFNLFISFDMSWGSFQVKNIPDFLIKYVGHASYYKVDNKPFVSTFWGGKISSDEWNNDFRQLLKTKHNVTPFFIPSFDDMDGYPNGLVNKFGSVIDGAFSWESAWPAPSNNKDVVSSAMDQSVMQQLGSKPYMMPLSPLQFKYASFGKWYRSGEINLPMRMEQILKLQPQFVEFLTWNDAGESHYIGNIFPGAIAGLDDIHAYTDGFDHKGWQQVITPFIKAFKQGATNINQILPFGPNPVGSLWYRTQLSTTSCNDGSFQNRGQAQDALNFAVLLPSSGYTIKVYSNDILLETIPGKAGLNYKMVLGLKFGGNQRIEILNGSNQVVAGATGTKVVQAQSSGCNWNYEVVGLSTL